MRILVSGGCKNGKSSWAEAWVDRHADRTHPLYYVATMLAKDEEDRDRIARHRSNRQGIPFVTLEQPHGISKLSDQLSAGDLDPEGFFLIDSITALLENEMFPASGEIRLQAGEQISADLVQLMGQLNQVILVSDYLYSDATFYTADLTDRFRQSLAQIDRAIAEHCDGVVELLAGCPIIHKGHSWLAEASNHPV